MLFYDWQKMFEAAEGSPLAIFIIFKMLTTNAVPRNKFDDIYKYAGKHFTGESFLVHPDVLLHNAYKHDYRDIAQYIALASLRPYADYLATGKTTLDLAICSVDPALFEENSLLHIEDGSIHFLYEEVKQETIH